MNQIVSPPAANLVWGAEAIGKAIGRTTRQTFHALEKGELAGAQKIAGRWVLNLDVFLETFSTNMPPARPAARERERSSKVVPLPPIPAPLKHENEVAR